MGNGIKCCNGCVPPKRNPYCHSTCPEYTEQKEKHDKEREIEFQKKVTSSNLEGQKIDAIDKAKKKRRK